MENVIYRIAILMFTLGAVAITHNNQCFLYLFLMLFFRPKVVKRSLLAEFDAVHDRLDNLTRNKDVDTNKTAV